MTSRAALCAEPRPVRAALARLAPRSSGPHPDATSFALRGGGPHQASTSFAPRGGGPRSGATQLALLALLALPGCGPRAAATPEVVLLVRSASPGTPLGPLDPRSVSADAILVGPGRLGVPLASLPRVLEIGGFCPHELDAAPAPAAVSSGAGGPTDEDESAGGPPRTIEVALTPLLDVPVMAPVGHDAPFRIEIGAGCREALAGSIDWSVVSVGGRAANDDSSAATADTAADARDARDAAVRSVALAVERRGFVVTGRTPAFAPPDTPRWGIVPVSARTSGEVVLRMRWSRPGTSAAIERTVRVLAAARATGLPSVPMGAGVLLRGGVFAVRERPTGSHAEVGGRADDLMHLLPDAPGRWVLEDLTTGRSLPLRVGEHAATPLDCGRSECHRTETEHALSSAMTGSLLAHVSEPCATACHATGEPGLPDGGFAHVARDLGWIAPALEPADPLAALRRPLRRLAGVGCTACHGPGAIPEETARWAILRSDVCATCHDAPPRYGHVAAWASSAMSRSDANEEARAAECATCHTTAGFLSSIGARARTDVAGDAGPIGIACAACHAPHSEHRLERALVRRIEPPAVLGELPASWAGATSTVCLGCHASAGDGRALASSAAILLAHGGLSVRDGAPLASSATADAAPHANLVCLDCHGAPAPSAGLGVERGASHAFAVDRARCVRCHADDDTSDAEDTPWSVARAALATRAAALAVRLELGPDDHARGAPVDVTTARGRTAFDLRLVLGDRGAWAHAPGYASALLDEIDHASE